VRRHGDDVEPDDVSLSDLTSNRTFVRPSVEAAGESGTISTELAEPISAPTHFPEGLHPTEGGYGVVRPAGSPSTGLPWDTPAVQQVRFCWRPKLKGRC